MTGRIDLALRPLSEADLPSAHRLSLTLRWPHRLEDWALLHHLGEGIAAVDEGGTLAGTGIWWPHGPDHATIGMVLVAPDRQGKGIGRKIMAALLGATNRRALMLNATRDGEPLYAALGFTRTGEVHQYQGIWTGPPGSNPRQPTRADLPTLLAIDEAAFGAPRPNSIAALLQVGTSTMAEDAFAIARPFGRGTVIGPVIAPSEAAALPLIATLADPGAFTRLDISSPSPALAAMLVANGLARVDTVSIMTRGSWLPPGPSRRFALIAQALG